MDPLVDYGGPQRYLTLFCASYSTFSNVTFSAFLSDLKYVTMSSFGLRLFGFDALRALSIEIASYISSIRISMISSETHEQESPFQSEACVQKTLLGRDEERDGDRQCDRMDRLCFKFGHLEQ